MPYLLMTLEQGLAAPLILPGRAVDHPDLARVGHVDVVAIDDEAVLVAVDRRRARLALRWLSRLSAGAFAIDLDGLDLSKIETLEELMTQLVEDPYVDLDGETRDAKSGAYLCPRCKAAPQTTPYGRDYCAPCEGDDEDLQRVEEASCARR